MNDSVPVNENTASCYDLIAIDTTNYCNLQCPFCYKNHAISHDKKNMEGAVFEKIIRLLPLAPKAGFFLSCLFEPTLHPKFIEFIYKIPEKHRDKVALATNLSMKLPDKAIDALAGSGIHHVNISLDSFQKENFKALRKNASFETFMNNLEKLKTRFSVTGNAPKIYFTTVVNKINYIEIPNIVENCATQFLSCSHEIRDFWILNHNQSWGVTNKISQLEWKCLIDKLSVLPYNFYINFKDYRGYRIVDEERDKNNAYSLETKGLRIDPYGTVELLGLNTSININDIDNVESFFKDIAALIDRDLQKTWELRSIADSFIREILPIYADENIGYRIDEIIFESFAVTLRGWCFNSHGKPVDIYFIFPDNKKIKIDFSYIESPDVENAHGRVASNCRFRFYILLEHKYAPSDFRNMKIEFKIKTI